MSGENHERPDSISQQNRAEDPHENPQMEASVQKAFRRGNINFDFLQPDSQSREIEEEDLRSERRTNSRQGKRGLFNRGRPSRPVSRSQVYLWAALFGVSAGLIFVLFFSGRSILLLLGLPVLFGTLLWSVIMLTLFLARPR